MTSERNDRSCVDKSVAALSIIPAAE